MINNSPPSAPAASSATSNTFTAPCSSPSCTASPTRPKHKPRSPYAKAIPSALGFYLDHGRVHVGDLAKITEDAFVAWVSDRAVGLDAIMLAPTRELVAELNRRARDHRLDGAPAGQEVRLGDGNRASVGDMIITRSNDRRLRLSATDWVKNGDRWTITHVDRAWWSDRAAQPQPAHCPATRRLRQHLDGSRLRHHHPSAPKASPPTPCTAC